MPYKSKAQAAYFNIHRKELERQGVDVDEWNESSRGKKLPYHVKKEKKAGWFNGRQIPDKVLQAIRDGDYSLLSSMGKNGNRVKARQNAFTKINPLPADIPNPSAITTEQLILGLPVRRPSGPYNRNNYIHNDSHGAMIVPSAAEIALWKKLNLNNNVKLAKSLELRELIKAKKMSDNKDYINKNEVLKKLLAKNPGAFKVDSHLNSGYVGITHKKSGFRIHVPKRLVPSKLIHPEV